MELFNWEMNNLSLTKFPITSGYCGWSKRYISAAYHYVLSKFSFTTILCEWARISFSVLKLQLIISSVIASNCLMCTWLRITLLTTVLAREGRIFFNTTQVRGLLTSLRTSSSPRQNHCHWHQLCQRPKRALPFPPLPVEQNLPISSRDNPNMHAQRIF